MHDRDRLLVIGAGGLLGQAVVRRAEKRAEPCIGVDWGRRAAEQVSHAVREFVASGGSGIIWVAGVGVIGTDRSALDDETRTFAAVLEALEQGSSARVFLASSGGGVYAGSRDVPITESSSPAPLAEYGRNKLRQERLLFEWARATGGRGIVGRIANVYGPGQSLDKAQGLITHLCRSAVTRQPVSIFVSFDTLRDYIYVDDAAELVVGCLDRSDGLEPGDVATKIIASSQSISVGGVFAEVRRVCPRPPAVIAGASAQRVQQGAALTFRSVTWPDLDAHELVPLPVGIANTYHGLRSAASLSGNDRLAVRT